MKVKKVGMVFAFAVLALACIMPAFSQTSKDETIYSLANNYYKIKSVYNGKYLLGNSAGYEAQATKAEDGMTFYFKASDLGEYILFDEDSKYLSENWFKAIIRNDELDNRVRYTIEQYSDGSFSIYSYKKNQYVGIKGTSLVWRSKLDKTCYYSFERTTGNNPFPEADLNVSFEDENGNPVSERSVMEKFKVGDKIIGYIDSHAHLNHNLASGEVVFNGESFNPLGVKAALDDCTAEHGVNGAYDIWGKAVDATGATHNTYGYPTFGYWPTSYSTTHMQTYFRWIERSYLAGQRVLVHQCVNNEILGQITNALPPYKNGTTNDMDAVEKQINNIYKMQDYIDAQCGGPGEGWFRVCTDAAQARQVISEGKMAVFLSIEVDTLFNCKTDYIGEYLAGNMSEEEMNSNLAYLQNRLDYVYDKGVRGMFLIHALNNGFGGCQLYQGELFSLMNYAKTGDFYQPQVSDNPRVFYKQPKADLPSDAQGHGNREGLSETGKWMMRQLIAKKMVIELDHMSDKSLNDTLEILWEEKYPGCIASHTRILDMFPYPTNETMEQRNWEQIDIPRMIKVYQLGGMISPMLWETLEAHQKCAADYLQFMIDLSENSSEPTTAVLDNPRYQVYGGPYEVPTTWYNMNDDESDDLICGIGFGSDVNGACMLPNFDACKETFPEIDYDDFTTLYDGVYVEGVEAKFDPQKTGDFEFNINGDRGVAHYGLIPDYWKRILDNEEMVNADATFNGAEAYLRMRERTERYSDTYPSREEAQWITTSTEYWH